MAMVATPAPVRPVVPHLDGGPRLGRLPALDGARAVAVALVLAHHSDALPGGTLGVDIFFVLSGFLITGLLLCEQHRHGSIMLRAFWVRRALRLLPAALVYLAIGTVLVFVLKGAEQQRDFLGNAATSLAYVNNWWRVHLPDSGGSWLAHFWSLSVEEQFYLVWPLLLVLLIRTRHRVALSLLAAAALLVVLHRWELVHDGQSVTRIYFGTDARADALLTGCALAFVWYQGSLNRLGRRAWVALSCLAWLTLLGLTVVPSMVLGGSPPSWQWSGWVVVEVATAVVVAACLTAPGHGPARLLAARPMVFVGRISYGVYLWHFPVVTQLRVFFGHPAQRWLVAGLGMAISVAVAWASHRWVEAPIAARRPAWASRAEPGVALVAAARARALRARHATS